VASISTSASTSTLYATLDGELLSSLGGSTWTDLGPLSLGTQGSLVVDALDSRHLAGFGATDVLVSLDGGATFESRPLPVDRITSAAIRAEGLQDLAVMSSGLWISSDGGGTWTLRDADVQYAILAWDAETLYRLYVPEDDYLPHLESSADGGTTFADVPLDRDQDATLSALWASDGLAVSSGHWYQPLVEGPDGLATFSTSATTVSHRIPGWEGVVGVAFSGDRVIVAGEGPQAITSD
jgi:hypothetical protein